jgi:chromosome segregation ATPase
MPPQSASGQIDPQRAREQRAQLENRIRIKKGSILDKERLVHEIDRDLRSLQEEVHHLEQDEKRLSDETHKMNQDIQREHTLSRSTDMGLRETTQNLQHKEEEIRRLERDIELLRAQIVEKEQRIHEIKEETRHLARDKEEFRRSGELGHFTAQTEQGHLHDAQLKLQLLTQSLQRKQNEVHHKEEQQRSVRREINFMQQELTQMEAELSHIPH